MCIALLQKPGQRISSKEFYEHSSSSPDGIGMMWIENKQLEIFKTLNNKEAWDKYLTICNLHGDKTYIALHFRNRTAGTISEENCHPFYVMEKKLGFMHVGVFHNLGVDPQHSDTWLFNEKILKPVGKNIFQEETWKLILAEVGKTNKLIFISPLIKTGYYIVNEDEGEWRNSIWYSRKQSYNYSYTYSAEIKKCAICSEIVTSFEKYFIINDKDYKNRHYVCEDCSKKDDIKFVDVINDKLKSIEQAENFIEKWEEYHSEM